MKQARRSLLHLQMGQEVLYLLMTVGIVASLVLIVYTQFVRADNASLRKLHAQDSADAAGLKGEIETLRNNKNSLLSHTAPTQTEQPSVDSGVPINDQPPIITLSEAQGYYFPSGSAELSDDFRGLLADNIVPRVLELSRRYDADVIEVVGHTDEVPVRSNESTIDETLLPFLSGKSS